MTANGIVEVVVSCLNSPGSSMSKSGMAMAEQIVLFRWTGEVTQRAIHIAMRLRATSVSPAARLPGMGSASNCTC